MKILVTGASGFIGSRLCRRLVAEGHEVVAVVRPRCGNVRYPLGEIICAQLPYGIPPRAFERVEVIIHCAGTTTGQGEAESLAVNVETTRVFAETARELPNFRRFIYVSSQSAHEKAVSVYGRTKRLGEEVLRGANVPWVILRPGLVFGPGTEGLFARMRRTVDRLPILPLLGGGKALVQPVEVEDLCTAIARCLDLPTDENFEFNIGEPEPMTLAEFLGAMARARRGKTCRTVAVPLAPLEAMVRLAEICRVKLPISRDNIEGMKTVQRMETRPSLERLGLTLTPFSEAMVRAANNLEDTALVQRPLRILLVGAGKIGIVHALDLRYRPQGALVGLVDKNPKAARLYHQMGFTLPVFADLRQAIAALKPDAAILATPASTHLELLRQCLDAGLHVLIEKPLMVSPSQRDEYLRLADNMGNRVVHVGYMAAQFPQLDVVRSWLREEKIGKIRGIWATALQYHIMAPQPVRWEMRKALAGGGVLTNFACHSLAILFRLIGIPSLASAHLWKIHSQEVEDAADLQLSFGDIPGRLVTSWSAKGYARPVMRIVFEGEKGTITITYGGAELKCARGDTVTVTQGDFDVGFNPSPDYTGAAFACEHENFLAAIIHSTQSSGNVEKPFSQTPVELHEALRLEEFIHNVYEHTPLGTTPPSQKASVASKRSAYDEELDKIAERLV